MPRKRLHTDGDYRLTLRLSQELATRLRRIADSNKRSLNAEIEFVLEKHANATVDPRNDQSGALDFTSVKVVSC